MCCSRSLKSVAFASTWVPAPQQLLDISHFKKIPKSKKKNSGRFRHYIQWPHLFGEDWEDKVLATKDSIEPSVVAPSGDQGLWPTKCSNFYTWSMDFQIPQTGFKIFKGTFPYAWPHLSDGHWSSAIQCALFFTDFQVHIKHSHHSQHLPQPRPGRLRLQANRVDRPPSDASNFWEFSYNKNFIASFVH